MTAEGDGGAGCSDLPIYLPAWPSALSRVFYLFTCQSSFPSVFASVTCLPVCQRCPQPPRSRPPSRGTQVRVQPRGPLPSSCSWWDPHVSRSWHRPLPAGHREVQMLGFRESYSLIAKLSLSVITVVIGHHPLSPSIHSANASWAPNTCQRCD